MFGSNNDKDLGHPTDAVNQDKLATYKKKNKIGTPAKPAKKKKPDTKNKNAYINIRRELLATESVLKTVGAVAGGVGDTVKNAASSVAGENAPQGAQDAKKAALMMAAGGPAGYAVMQGAGKVLGGAAKAGAGLVSNIRARKNGYTMNEEVITEDIINDVISEHYSVKKPTKTTKNLEESLNFESFFKDIYKNF